MINDAAERRNYRIILFTRYPECLFFLPKMAIFMMAYLYRRIRLVFKIITKAVRQVIKPGIGLISGGTIFADKIRLDLNNFSEITFLSLTAQELTGIWLASTTIPVVADLDWNYPFPDEEDSFALHRFGWLLSALVQCPSANLAENGIIWLNNWIKEKGQPGSGPAWESYSVAERLANWPFILAMLNRLVALPPHFLGNMEKSMLTQVDYLMLNLEFRGRLTNNHLLNDARGLYIAGVLLGSQAAMQKAREIFLEWTKDIFYEDGMLKENSSHYQSLLCQRFEQIYFLSQHAQDRQFQKFMEHWLTLMADCRDFFSVYDLQGNWDMPLIGDLSPDFPPGWLAPTSESKWTVLKQLLGWRDQPRGRPLQPKAWKIKRGGFIRYSLGEVTLFWHINPEDSAFLGHGHYDLGSFVLFYAGKQVLVDPGRCSYVRGGSFGAGARAHSSLLIDYLGPQCEDLRLNSFKAYGRQKIKYHISDSTQGDNLEIEADGFKRLRTPVAWKRRFTVRENRVIIVDLLESVGANRVDARFQVNSGFEVHEFGGGLKISSGLVPPLELKVGDSNPYRCELLSGEADGEGWVSREYGRRSSGTTILFQRELYHRQVHTYEIIWP